MSLITRGINKMDNNKHYYSAKIPIAKMHYFTPNNQIEMAEAKRKAISDYYRLKDVDPRTLLKLTLTQIIKR